MPSSNFPSRPQLLNSLKTETFDLLVVGGGATGAGIALDAASRGMKTALVEKVDFAFGTSSRSTKLIHGGLRYLKQFEVKLVREVGRERAIVHRLAPHLVVSEPMLLPLIKGGTFGRLATSLGLWVYDFLAGVKGKDRRKMLTKRTTMDREPMLRKDLLLGGGLYAEYRTDDARLTIENVKTAMSHGAVAANYLTVKGLLYEEGIVQGVTAQDGLTEEEFPIRARQVVSAAGPWVDEIRQMNGSLDHRRLFLSKGVHLVFPQERLPLSQSVYFDVADGRMIFAIPRGNITYVGTTDTEYKGVKERPRTTQADVEYLLEAANAMFPSANLTLQDVSSSWAGLRPLIREEGKGPSEISRKDEIFLSDTRLISIAGGKLTGYRKMAEKVVDLTAKLLQEHHHRSFQPCRTKEIPLAGGGVADTQAVDQYREQVTQKLAQFGLNPFQAWYLVHLYGKQTDDILQRFALQAQQDEKGLILAELAYCLERELVQTVPDFFIRRTGRLYFNIDSVREHLELVLAEMANHFQWPDRMIQEQRSQMLQEVEEVSTFPSLKEVAPA